MANWMVQARITASGSDSRRSIAARSLKPPTADWARRMRSWIAGLANGRRTERLEHRIHQGARPSFLEDSAGVPGMPLVGKSLHLHERTAAQLLEVLLERLRFSEADLEDPPVGAVVAVHVVVVALVLVVPIDHEDAAVGPVLEADDLRPEIVGQEEVGGVRADETRTAGLQDVAVDPSPVDVVHEQRALVLGRPGTAQIDHRPRVRMAAAGGVGPAVAAVRVGPQVMPVVGDRLDVVVGIGIEMLARLPLVPASLDHVIKMRDHAGRDDHLAARIEVDAPGVAGAMGEDLEDVPGRVVAPDARV